MTRMFKMMGVAALLTVGLAAASAADPIVFTQPSEFPGGTLYASQNDPGGFGQFATVFDDFTLALPTTITGISWQGGYWNPTTQGSISQFTIQFWSDGGGGPAGLLQTHVIAGTANETSLGPGSVGSPIFEYSAGLTFGAAPGVTYWVSIVPDLEFPPQWGWQSGTGGNGLAFQDFMGESGALEGTDLAFSLSGNAVPEPGTLLLLGSGLTGLVLRRRRRQGD